MKTTERVIGPGTWFVASMDEFVGIADSKREAVAMVRCADAPKRISAGFYEITSGFPGDERRRTYWVFTRDEGEVNGFQWVFDTIGKEESRIYVEQNYDGGWVIRRDGDEDCRKWPVNRHDIRPQYSPFYSSFYYHRDAMKERKRLVIEMAKYLLNTY